MFNFAVTVTRDTATNAYTWTYGNSQDLACTTNVATVPAHAIGEIQITIQSGTPGDSVVFSSKPLQFKDGPGGPDIDSPSWYLVEGQETKTITITDNNSHPPLSTKSYCFLFQCSYTPGGGTAETKDSPDPTIINTGTGGIRLWIFPSRTLLVEVAA